MMQTKLANSVPVVLVRPGHTDAEAIAAAGLTEDAKPVLVHIADARREKKKARLSAVASARPDFTA